MSKTIVSGVTALFVVFSTPAPGLAQTVHFEGKTIAAASANFVAYTANDVLFSVQIEKGKKKSLLLADVTVDIAGTTLTSLTVTVSGVAAAPVDGLVNNCPGGDCTVGGTFVLDLDANSALIGQPLTVEVRAFYPGGGPLDAFGSLVVRMEKKK